MGDDAGKALSPVLGTCDAIIGVREKGQKLMGGEEVETAYNS